MLETQGNNRKLQLLRNKILYLELSKLINNIDFDYVIIKGEPLSYYEYGEYGRRDSIDIDVLIDRSNISNMINILLQNGYTCKSVSRFEEVMLISHSHQYIPWKKKLSNGIEIILDINFDIFWGEYKGEKVNINKFIQNYVKMDIYGVQIKTLPLASTFIQLILHHYKELNSIYIMSKTNTINYNILQDVRLLIINNMKELNAKKICSISKQYSIRNYAFFVLYYTYKLYKDEILQDYIKALETDEGRQLLNCFGLSKEERYSWKIGFDERMNNNFLFDFVKKDLDRSVIQKIEINNDIFN